METKSAMSSRPGPLSGSCVFPGILVYIILAIVMPVGD